MFRKNASRSPSPVAWVLGRITAACSACTAVVAAAICVAACLPNAARALQAAELRPESAAARFRGPVALVLVDDGRSLLVANRRSGSISTIDADTGEVTGEAAIGKKLSALIAIHDRNLFLATDEAAHELVLIGRDEQALSALARLPVPEYPVSVVSSPDGTRCAVASLWSRRLSVFALERTGDDRQPIGPRRFKTLDLPFAPRKQFFVDGGRRLIVADAFGGKLAVVDTIAGELEAIRELPAHNIRGLALSADGRRLLVAHQILNSLARTTPDDVHWGMVMGNVVRALRLEIVLDKHADILQESVVHPIGEAGNAAGDPAEIALTADGHVAVAMAGVGELGLFPEDDSVFHRIALGGRPAALAVTTDGDRVYTADELSDTVSVIDVKQHRRIQEISLGRQPELSLAERGERLFYDARLSHDGWMSCHSCHTDGHSNGQLNDNLADGGFGAPKRVLSLMGVGRTRPWAWNGEMGELEAQIRKSIETTMRGAAPTDEQVRALAAFLKTLPHAPPVDSAAKADRAAIERGRGVFESRRCNRCHTPPDYTSEAAYDVGLKDQFDNAKFNPPSLRGVSQREALFHDNRAASLEEVLSRFRHQLTDDLTNRDQADLLAFLRSL